jgi:hypothetical protein
VKLRKEDHTGITGTGMAFMRKEHSAPLPHRQGLCYVLNVCVSPKSYAETHRQCVSTFKGKTKIKIPLRWGNAFLHFRWNVVSHFAVER